MSDESLQDAIIYTSDAIQRSAPGKAHDTLLAHLENLLLVQRRRASVIFMPERVTFSEKTVSQGGVA